MKVTLNTVDYYFDKNGMQVRAIGAEELKRLTKLDGKVKTMEEQMCKYQCMLLCANIDMLTLQEKIDEQQLIINALVGKK